jgi:hypothetical protein
MPRGLVDATAGFESVRLNDVPQTAIHDAVDQHVLQRTKAMPVLFISDRLAQWVQQLRGLLFIRKISGLPKTRTQRHVGIN